MKNTNDEDAIFEINRKYFSNNHAEVNIIEDLKICIERLITILTFEKILFLAAEGYDPNHHESEEYIDENGAMRWNTIFTYIDRYNYAEMHNIHSMLMDGLVISFRNFFYCKKGSNSAGTFVMELAEKNNLKTLNRKHLRNLMGGKVIVAFVSKNDLKKGYIKIGNDKITLDARSNRPFIIYNEEKKYCIYYDRNSGEAHRLAKKFYQHNYLKNNKRDARCNLSDIEEYEKYNLHKDRWPNNRKYRISIEPECLHGYRITHEKREILCNTDFKKLTECLEEAAKIINLYYVGCKTRYLNPRLIISFPDHDSLFGWISSICSLFQIHTSETFMKKVEKEIRKRIPYILSLTTLR